MAIIFWMGLLVMGVLSLALVGLWTLPPILSGLPWRPTAPGRIRKALQMAKVQPGELMYDLGCGDGRVVVLAAREFNTRAVGVEISPLHCLASQYLAWSNRVGGQVRILRADFNKVDLSRADVVFAYMTSAQVERLKPHLEGQLHAGARVVTISFDIDSWKPQAVDRDELIFMYRMPPQPGSLATFLEEEMGSLEPGFKGY